MTHRIGKKIAKKSGWCANSTDWKRLGISIGYKKFRSFKSYAICKIVRANKQKSPDKVGYGLGCMNTTRILISWIIKKIERKKTIGSAAAGGGWLPD